MKRFLFRGTLMRILFKKYIYSKIYSKKCQSNEGQGPIKYIQKIYSKNIFKQYIQKLYSKNIFKKYIQNIYSKNIFKK